MIIIVQYPGQAHMDAALHVLRYLRGTYDQAILYQHVHTLVDTLWGWVDSDWAANVDSRSEAEYVAASQCGQEVYYMREILRDFGYTQTAPTHIYEDNLACVTMSENLVRCKFSRHIDIRRYFVCNIWWPQVSSNLCLSVPISW